MACNHTGVTADAMHHVDDCVMSRGRRLAFSEPRLRSRRSMLMLTPNGRGCGRGVRGLHDIAAHVRLPGRMRLSL